MVDADSRFEVVYPLRRRAGRAIPFPTLYWLRDANLVRELSELERLGGVGRCEQRIAENPELRQAYHADHERYRAARWAALSDADRALVNALPSLTRAFDRGIAGIANFDAVKCLHAQYAFHLAEKTHGGTTVGRLLVAALSEGIA